MARSMKQQQQQSRQASRPALRPNRRTHLRGACTASAGCLAGEAARVLPAISLKTVVELQAPRDLQYVLMASELVTETFYSASDNPVFDAVNFNSYRMRAAAQTLGLHMAGGRSHATILALTAQQQQQQQQEYERRRHSRSAVTSESQETQPAGVVNITLMSATSSVAAAAQCKLGTPYAMLTNMAVSPVLRRRGIAHHLMQAALRTALVELDCTPAFAMLLAYKHYEPAVKLYQSWGFADTDWVDPLWLEDAEKGRLGRQRATMMVKQLSGPGLTSCPTWERLKNL